jgi:hypothetical protein
MAFAVGVSPMGSPNSIVASAIPTESVNGRLAITLAFAKSSFDGGAPLSVGEGQRFGQL